MFSFKVKLFRYADPSTGPRKLPVTGNHLKGKVEMSRNACFEVDVAKNVVMLIEGQKKHELGDQITYVVE